MHGSVMIMIIIDLYDDDDDDDDDDRLIEYGMVKSNNSINTVCCR